MISSSPASIAPTDGAGNLNHDLEDVALTLAEDDTAGLRWCEKHGYPGYTSYASRTTCPGGSRL